MIGKLANGGMDKSLNTFLNQLGTAKTRMFSLNEQIGSFIDGLKNSLKYNISNAIWRGAQQQF
jgi:hypothetical protein